MNLHAKVFLGFWLSMLGIVVAWLITDQYIRLSQPDLLGQESGAWEADRPPPRPGAGVPPGPLPAPPQLIFRVLYNLQTKSLEELPDWIADVENKLNLRIMIFNRYGEEVFDADVVPGSLDTLRKIGVKRQRAAHREGNTNLFAQEINRTDGERLAVVVATLPPRSPIIHALSQYLWLRLALAVVFTALISYLVSRYLTRPLKALQAASMQLAAGKLDTRIATPPSGGDETVRLARDFNTMADRLQEQIQAQKRLLSDVSHELRSPLARLRVALALAEKDPNGATDQMTRIEQETERLDELIGQLLDVPEYNIELEDSVDLVGLAEKLCADARYEAEAVGKEVTFTTDLEEALLHTKGDLLVKALDNVIRNAVNYTLPATAVEVSLYSQDKTYLLSVCDRGQGIPDDACERIFEPFFRVDEARTRETGGYGLGLHIARQSVLKHGGSIRAYNRRGQDQGLCIQMTFPAASLLAESIDNS